MAEATRGKKAAQTRAKKQFTRERAEREAEAEQIYHRLVKGDKLKRSSLHSYFFSDGTTVSWLAVSLLLQQHRAQKKNGAIVLHSPEEYAKKLQEIEREATANRRRRLDRWAKMITEALGITIKPGTLDDVLTEIAREAMSLGSLED